MGVVSKYLRDLIVKQIDDNGVVVWYDPDGTYATAVETLDCPDTEILRYDGSFIHLRCEIDQKKFLDGEEPPRLLVYVPMGQEQSLHALIEMEAAGVVMQPGQQPPQRNTRLAVVARNALRELLGDETAASIEKQAESGKLTLADLDNLAEKGEGISTGVLALVFGTGNPQEVAASFLSTDRLDKRITEKDAKGELLEVLRSVFGFDAGDKQDLNDLRHRLARHILMTELVSSLGEFVPSKLSDLKIATEKSSSDACRAVCRAWRLRRDTRESYVESAERVEEEFGLGSVAYDAEAMGGVETFPAVERALLRDAENRLLEHTDGEILTLAESRLSQFWSEVKPSLQARWALVKSVAEVLLEADRVENAMKKAPSSVTGFIKEYAENSQPWCLLDTYHRNMESKWYNYEPYGDDHDNIEKLVIKAGQRYAEIGSQIARHFLELLQKEAPGEKVAQQRNIFDTHVKLSLGRKKIAYVWVDALRLEMGRELARLLKEDFEVDLRPVLAAVPTVTEMGMAALLPLAQDSEKVVAAGNSKLALEIDGTIIKDRKDRVEYLKKHAGVEVFDTKLDNLLPKPTKKIREGIAKAELILVTSQEIDELCEKDNITQARRQMDGILNDLRRGVRVLVDQGVERIILTADHGHIFAGELSEDMKVDPPGGDTADLHRRVWVGQGGTAGDAFLRLPLKRFGIESDFDLATPWTFACFKCKGGGKAYFHGGLSPQELIVPLMILSPSGKAKSSTPSVMTWKISPGTQKLTTRFFSVQISGANTGLFDVDLPKVRVELRAKKKTISQAVSASYGFEEATGDIVLRYDEEHKKDTVPNTVTLMLTDEPDQKTVGLYLIDADTGAELSRLENIEVAISI